MWDHHVVNDSAQCCTSPLPVVNEDGTLRRIANWDLLTPSEKEVAQRRIASRNKVLV